MKPYDLIFHAIMLAFDAGVAVCIYRKAPHARVPRVLAVVGLASVPLVVSLAVILSAAFATRSIFMLMRFVGYALFWHAPLLLLIAVPRPWRALWVRPALVTVAAGLILAYFYAYWVEPFRLEVTHYDYTSPQLAGLERPITLLQVSDQQTEHFGEFDERVLQTIVALHPDMVAFTGDYGQGPLPNYLADMDQIHRRLVELGFHPPLGAFAVRGDCDPSRAWKSLFEGLPVKTLEDEYVSVALPGCRINLIGLNRPTSRTTVPGFLERIAPERDRDALDLVLGHAPDYAMALAQTNRPFLALAGHTHGGQVVLPFIGPLLTLSSVPRPYAYQFLPMGPGVLSTSRGIGMERMDAPQLRFRCRPELRLITLRPPASPRANP